MTVYIETNFVIGAAVGRDPDADELLRLPGETVRLAIPTVCVIEAWSWFEDEQKRRNRFRQELTGHIGQLRRDVTSAHARSLLAHLEEARVENDSLLNDVRRRLWETLAKLAGLVSGYSRADLILLTPEAFTESLNVQEMGEPTDALILAVILDHALVNSGESRALLSGNSKHFNTPEIRSLLSSAGIDKYFATTRALLDYLQSGSE